VGSKREEDESCGGDIRFSSLAFIRITDSIQTFHTSYMALPLSGYGERGQPNKTFMEIQASYSENGRTEIEIPIASREKGGVHHANHL
jgi:hypothetical protein